MKSIDERARAAEDNRIRRLRVLVDTAALVLRHRPLTRVEAELLVADVRGKALSLFPDGGDTFDLIYGPRFRRLIDARYGSAESA